MDIDPVAARVARMRRFNRFYTQKIGVLEEGYLASGASLTDVRVVYELAHRDDVAAVDLARDLGLDAGYLSRVVRRLERQGLVGRTTLATDRRRSVIGLTAAGRAFFAQVDQRSRDDIGELFEAVSEPDQIRLVGALDTIQQVLEPDSRSAPSLVVLRPHRPGDMGWVVQAHGELYAREFGWTSEFEALVAEIVAGFLRSYDLAREHCWIAERDGQRVGSVFVVRQADEVAKLRLLLVDPAARGTGLGRLLVRECVRFARDAGYRTLSLWTNDVLVPARSIYQSEGFRLTHSESHRSFGQDLVGETWELGL